MLNRNRSTADPLGLLGTMIVVGLLFASCDAYAAPCKLCRQQQKFVANYVAPSLAYTPSVQYMIGQQVRQTSVDTAAFRASDEYQEYIELRAWRAGFEARAALGAEAPPAPLTPKPEQPAEELADPTFPLPSPLPDTEPTGPQPTPADARFANKIPTLVARCSKCHTGNEPKGDLWIDGTVDLTTPDAAEKRDSIIRAVAHGHMPPSGQPPLSDAEFTAVLYELYPEETK